MKVTPGRVDEMQMAKPSKEVERKWLVLDPLALSKFKRVKIVQGLSHWDRIRNRGTSLNSLQLKMDETDRVDVSRVSRFTHLR